MVEVAVVQVAFPLDDLKHVRLAARRAGTPFFERTRVDWSYSRTVHAGRGLLFVAHSVASRPAWRCYLAFFARLADGTAWLVLLPHAAGYAEAVAARRTSEELGARFSVLSWQQAVGAFAARARQSAPAA
ncbi:hypothetical protein [Streptomyces sp. NPDC058572]|uniref:hypothetical protein n=1 Tax=Streptomyces sp. NPDC058572 TaxID=3346546 RepID=UPI0036645852